MSHEELDFSTFCIGILADHLKMNQCSVYELLIKTGLLYGYIIPCYSSLHTFGRQYIIDDLIEHLKEKGAL